MRRARIDIFRSLDSLRRDLKSPREYDRYWKTDDEQANDKPNRPIRHIEHGKDLRNTLRQRPPRDRIRDRDFVNIAPLQLGEEIVDLHFEFRNVASSRAGRIFSASASKRGSPWSGLSNGSKRSVFKSG